MRGADVLVNNDAVLHVEADIKPSTFDFAMDLLTAGGGYTTPGERIVAAADVSYQNVEALFDSGAVEIAPLHDAVPRQRQFAPAVGGAALSR